MATYASQTDIENAIGGSAALKALTDPTNTAINTTAVASALAYGTGEVDARAAGKPGTTSTTEGALWGDSTPTQAKHCTISLAVYRLYEMLRREVPKSIADAYANALVMLEEMRTGKTAWVPTEPPAADNVGTVHYFGPGSTARDDNPRRTLRDTLDAL